MTRENRDETVTGAGMREKDMSYLVRFREGERRWERETLNFVPLTCVCLVLKLCSKKWILYGAFCAKFCAKCCKIFKKHNTSLPNTPL